MVRLTTCGDGFEARVLAARLGSEGIVWSLRGGHDGPLAFGTVDVLVDADDLDTARELLGDDDLELAAARRRARAGDDRPRRALFVALHLSLVRRSPSPAWRARLTCAYS